MTRPDSSPPSGGRPAATRPEGRAREAPFVACGDTSPRGGRAGANSLEARVLDILSRVPDPEIPAVSVVDLGIVRGIRDGAVAITPTYTGCPATLAIERAVREALDAAGLDDIPVLTELTPPWTTDWISDEGREKLRAYGIAPPPKGAGRERLGEAAPAACPRCGSTHTEEISRFGSTPCKALWRCLDCAEPFDRFKCH